MPKRIVPLTDVKVRNVKPAGKDVKLFDGGGLYLLVTRSGGKLWQFKYRYDGKEKKLAFGSYPEVSLADARDKRESARKLVASGVDPGVVRKAQKAARASEVENSFEVVAREWHSRFLSTWTPGHAMTIMSRLERDVFPWLGSRPIVEIKATELLMALRKVEIRGALETAHRIRTVCGQVFRYAVATGRAERDISADLRGALPPVSEKHHASITEPAKIAELLRAIEGYQGGFVVRCALQLAPMLFVRPGELRAAEWSEFDLDAGEWHIPADRMKMKQAHLVPLSSQAVEILRELQKLTGSSRYVFPSGRSFHRCMSNNAVNAALRRMGYEKDEMTGHGFRAMARTILDEVLHFRPDYIEHQLAHAVKDPNGRAYNRTAHLAERKKMMQTWADYLDGLKRGAKILSFPGHAQGE
ncbi:MULTISPECIES: tyrosine-type recombinase/integrase [Geobacter]|uniref:tyrosine-type recombinase/integrase n=1 Tax=Geobacter TaxID=28231 RepID=UPI0025740264|nr:integrase arm-type DNA-binding domain-containing protein [Geobacter sulfurreducens]BEH10311.1 tyrosine-type recombinase/integrase [Geobacter sulfurreducens subsp. ethanolicus]BET58101.1 tyrosine-type recombinase/integrase [Geobacter sp. 60473]